MRTMEQRDIRELLKANRLGILSLSHDGDSYGLPLFYAYDGRAVYFHTLPGAKIRYLASTREACLTVTTVRTYDEWASVQVFGPIQRVDGTPDELAAMHALMAIPLPPEFGYSPQGEPRRADAASTYKLNIVRMSGRFSDRHPEPRSDSYA